MRYRYLLFDLDGTLTDPKEGITKSVQYALEAFGIHEPDLDKLLCFIGPPLQDSFADFYGMGQEQVAQAVSRFRERYKECGVFENRVFDGITAMLDELFASGRVLAVSTSKPNYFADMVLEKYGLRSYFKVVVGSELDGRRSKKSEVIEETILQLGLTEDDRSEILMIGDRKHDILGAKECRLDSMGVRFGYAEENELEDAGADYIAATVSEAKQLLLQL